MIRNLQVKIKKAHPRTIRSWKHGIYSAIIKGGGVMVGLLLVPLSIDFLSAERFGVWLTLSTFIMWFAHMDIGIGNGLRNKLVEAIANQNNNKARILISTAYATAFCIFAGVFLIFILLHNITDWSIILNAPRNLKEELYILMPIVFGLFCLQFVLKLITNIFYAFQKAAIPGLLFLISNLLILITLLLLKKHENSLLIFGLLYGLAPLIVYFLASIIFFAKHKNHIFSPSLGYISLSHIKPLFGLGLSFFVIQISAAIMQTSSTFIIAHNYSPIEVTEYNVAYRYINTFYIIFTLIMLPFWSATTDAYSKNEINWIKQSKTTMNWVSGAFLFAVGVSIIISPWVYNIWIGNNVEIDLLITMGVALYVMSYIISEPTMQLINGIGKMKLQAWLSFIVVLINIPIALWLNSLVGLVGIILAPAIMRLMKFTFAYIQLNKLLNNSAKGIWNA